jgi:hypothetical protein
MAARSAAEVSTLTLIEDGGTVAAAQTELSDTSKNSMKSRDKMAVASFGFILNYQQQWYNLFVFNPRHYYGTSFFSRSP